MLTRVSSRSFLFIEFLLLLLFFFSLSRFHQRSFTSLLSNDPKFTTSDPSENLPSTIPTDLTGYTILNSLTTPDRKYFPIDFSNHSAANPNIIPHQQLPETWWIVAQSSNLGALSSHESTWFQELVCPATFKNNILTCTESPIILPIAATQTDKCIGELAYFGMSIGPHDARVFYGPEVPYTIYGSQSGNACFGQWVQDFRRVVDWGPSPFPNREFTYPVDIQRPPPTGLIEKNYFLFWDFEGGMYAHYDMYPSRTFSKLFVDGSASSNLASKSKTADDRCLAHYLPKMPPTLESIHQATNSLSITLCNKKDEGCVSEKGNTFIATIIQHKTFYFYHGVYEPYLILFNSFPPFSVYGVSKKPLWINGRGEKGKGKIPQHLMDELRETWDQTEMVYVTSLSWREGGRYNGFLDQGVFLGFGIEDERPGGIDVLAADLVGEMGLCADVAEGEGEGLGLGFSLEEERLSWGKGGKKESGLGIGEDNPGGEEVAGLGA